MNEEHVDFACFRIYRIIQMILVLSMVLKSDFQ